MMCVVSVLSVSVAMSQTDEERSEMAKQMLDKMQAKNKSYASTTAMFVLTLENHQDNSKREYKGMLKTKGNKYVLDVVNTVTFFDGSAVCTWLKDDREANITSADDAGEAAIGPMQILGSYGSGYKMRYLDDVTVDKAVCAEIDLYPTDHKSRITRVRLTVDKSTYTIKRIMQQCKDGTVYYVAISSFKTNVEIADSEFTFDVKQHPDVEVVDLR